MIPKKIDNAKLVDEVEMLKNMAASGGGGSEGKDSDAFAGLKEAISGFFGGDKGSDGGQGKATSHAGSGRLYHGYHRCS